MCTANAPGANNFVRTDAEVIDNADRFLGRADLRLSNTDNVFARYIYTTRTRVIPGWFGGMVDGTSTSAFGDQKMKSHGLVAGWTRIFSPSVVNEFRFSWAGTDSQAVQIPFGEAPPEAARVPGVPVDPRFDGALTAMLIDTYFGGGARIGSPELPAQQYQKTNSSSTGTRSPGSRATTSSSSASTCDADENESLDIPATRGELRFRGRFTGLTHGRLPPRLRVRFLLRTCTWCSNDTGPRQFFVQGRWR